MKNYILIILLSNFFLGISCKSNTQVPPSVTSDKILGKVTGIDSTKTWYIINFEYEINKKGVFISHKRKCKNIKKRVLIKINHSYNFELTQMMQNNYNERELVFEIEGKKTWESSSGIDYFENCNNVCGLYIW